MFMRFLQLKTKLDRISEFKNFYETEVMPELHKTPGCLFAGLIKSKPEENELISLTFWQTLAHAEKYESSEPYKKLLGQAKIYLSESAEWKLQLSENSELLYAPVEEEPVTKKYVVAVKNEDSDEFMSHSSNMFVRVLSLVIQDDKLDEFKKLYAEHIIPSLKLTEGCRYVYLTESVNEKNEFISVTIWDKKEYAEKYEASGKFQELTNIIKHTFSQFYLWKMSLEKNYGAIVSTSDDFKIEGYNIVTGKSFL